MTSSSTRGSRAVYRRRRVLVAALAIVVAVLLVAIVGVVFTLVNVGSIHRSSIAMPQGSAAPAQQTGDVNLLIMGLDSRVDENGQPYPQEIYDAIHAEDESVGGYNTNVLMYVHIPGDGSPAVGVSIPRDDYVDYANAPGGVTKGKIKEDYGRTLEATLSSLHGKGLSENDAYQKARDAAREAELQTVSNFLGGVRIDHFVEVTMAAFYRVAQAVAPVTVCLNEATADTFSGANFVAGVQQLSASQAMAFVRQRRDTEHRNVSLSDLDRTRRQQAFMIAVAAKLRDAHSFTDPGTLSTLVDTAKQYVALDSGFDLLSLANDAQRLSGGGMSFQTLPVERFGMVGGESVNIVDKAKIDQIVAGLLAPPSTASATPTPAPAPSAPSHHAGGATKTAPSVPATTPSGASVYTDAEQPMGSGGMVCVN